ncbi:MAG TPA: helicase SNF2, partial [Pseudomonadota bacterium]|nr:helicase SNF2 [Pseudomonadota bacterium]
AIGGKDDVQRFCQRALARLGSGLSPLRRGYKVALSGLPDDVRDRLETEGLSGTVSIDFSYPSAPGFRPVQRSHPLVSVLAETLLERTLGSDRESEASDPGVLGRIGTWIADGVTEKTTVVLLRLRHQLICQRGEQTTTLLCEEATALAFVGSEHRHIEGDAALALLEPPPVGDPPPPVRERMLLAAMDLIQSEQESLRSFADLRAQELLSDHRRVRTASDARGSYSVKPLLPADVIGVYVLLPKVN